MSTKETSLVRQPAPLTMLAQTGALLKPIGLVSLVILTNPQSWERFVWFYENAKWEAIIRFAGVWSVAVICLCIAAFQPKFKARLFWALLISFSTAVSFGYYLASHSQPNMLDVISLWNERHEAGRASEFYWAQIYWALGIFAVSTLIFLKRPAALGNRADAWLSRLALLPLLPVVMVAFLYWSRGGTLDTPMPSQFNTLSLASLLTYKVNAFQVPVRKNVSWTPGKPLASGSIVVLMDESLRADYLDFTPGNRFTPNLAALSMKFVNFGPAASAGNCSNYSNALVRFGASREDIVASVNSNATLFDYAKKAGYRTVYIDAQAHTITNGNKIQNFMTMKEKAAIDGFYAIDNVPPWEADRELARIISKEVKSPTPVFIYANKYGAHFPYDAAYPKDHALFHPTMTENAEDTVRSRIASYRNAVAWSVDGFWNYFVSVADLSSTTVIYTSDHGQRFVPGDLSHCMTVDPDARLGLVPLLVMAPDQTLREKFALGADRSMGRANHFMIAPTIYQMMGYSKADIATSYDESLFDGTVRSPEFTGGDVFGMFGSKARAASIDLSKTYLEPEAQ